MRDPVLFRSVFQANFKIDHFRLCLQPMKLRDNHREFPNVFEIYIHIIILNILINKLIKHSLTKHPINLKIHQNINISPFPGRVWADKRTA